MNENHAILRELIEDLEEILQGQGYVYMYDFAWTLRGYECGLTATEITSISLLAHREMTSRFPLRLMWTTWPSDIDRAWPAAADTELDFDLDPDGPLNEPLLVLVPPPRTLS